MSLLHYIQLQLHDPVVKATTAGGTAFSLLASWSPDILKTIVLACIGAVVSFSVSLLLNKIFKKK